MLRSLLKFDPKNKDQQIYKEILISAQKRNYIALKKNLNKFIYKNDAIEILTLSNVTNGFLKTLDPEIDQNLVNSINNHTVKSNFGNENENVRLLFYKKFKEFKIF